MNYIKQLNEFYKNITTEPLTSNAKNLYETLLHINSDSYWREEIIVANTYLILLTGLNISALQRARNTLIQEGYIKYKKGIGNNAGTYTIINLVVQNKDEFEQQTDSEPTINRTTNRQESEHINKLNKTKQNNKEKYKKENEDKNILPASEDKSSSAFAKANKHKYGTYKNVLLKDKELQSLKGEYQNWEELITYLDEYIEMKGYKAKSHYLCIKKWVVDAVKRESNKQITKNINNKSTDWLKEELENEN